MSRSPKITRDCPFCGEAEYLRLDEGEFARSAIIDGQVQAQQWDDADLKGVDMVDGVYCLTCDTIAALDTWNGTRPAVHYALLRDWDVEPKLV